MGIDYDSGRLPFVIDLDRKNKVATDADGLYDENQIVPYKNGWSFHFVYNNIDDIILIYKLFKGEHSVWLTTLDLICGEDHIAVAEQKQDLEEFMKDFKIVEKIEENIKVVQVG